MAVVRNLPLSLKFYWRIRTYDASISPSRLIFTSDVLLIPSLLYTIDTRPLICPFSSCHRAPLTFVHLKCLYSCWITNLGSWFTLVLQISLMLGCFPKVSSFSWYLPLFHPDNNAIRKEHALWIGNPSWSFFLSSSMTTAWRKRLKASTWLSPMLKRNILSCPSMCIHVLAAPYMCLIILSMLVMKISFSLNNSKEPLLALHSYSYSKSTNNAYTSPSAIFIN